MRRFLGAAMALSLAGCGEPQVGTQTSISIVCRFIDQLGECFHSGRVD